MRGAGLGVRPMGQGLGPKQASPRWLPQVAQRRLSKRRLRRVSVMGSPSLVAAQGVHPQMGQRSAG